MKFCSQCGASVRLTTPPGDNRPRYVCSSCHLIHYQNPRIVTGCIPIYGDKVLLCKRAIEPRYGYWTLPAGFMENGESCEEGATRETLEEACAEVRELQLYTMFSLPHIDQVHLFYLAQMSSENYAAGTESLEVQLLSEQEIPWDELAFPTIGRTLRHFFADRQHNHFPVRSEALLRPVRAN
ncbi:NUDIX hydrolase [Aestuariirhabdus litorea]|uniref:NUDIX domain-containing protein n=1 Tax=Aestuariirhabdus litorea TaxID=2528527 RepID=A0A3P3VR69_9GAMM|nr:NUDIX hydrolase [Aestuariirhabdus litorea]RRJ85291.1 NUDIX domain-containing protein [Aestuariirhabdus litorea]RWW98513.1 NUDIX domain-containing protein [Endozoicomonadaceae bacterium GTF-13]